MGLRPWVTLWRAACRDRNRSLVSLWQPLLVPLARQLLGGGLGGVCPSETTPGKKRGDHGQT